MTSGCDRSQQPRRPEIGEIFLDVAAVVSLSASITSSGSSGDWTDQRGRRERVQRLVMHPSTVSLPPSARWLADSDPQRGSGCGPLTDGHVAPRGYGRRCSSHRMAQTASAPTAPMSGHATPAGRLDDRGMTMGATGLTFDDVPCCPRSRMSPNEVASRPAVPPDLIAIRWYQRHGHRDRADSVAMARQGGIRCCTATSPSMIRRCRWTW
jgi:hypothetical protein